MNRMTQETKEISGDDLESEFDNEDIEVIEEASTNCVERIDGQLGLETYILRLT
jgi:hypothetical protein